MNSVKIPWIHGYDWLQVKLSITRTTAAMGKELQPLEEIAQQINTVYGQIDGDLEKVSKKTCISCADVCCTQATVWFDLPDLLYLYLCNKRLPEQQIFRLEGGLCCKLTSSGCSVSRNLRPFICTWYICAAQKDLVDQTQSISQGIKRIKDLRKQLENQYVLSSS